MATDTEETQGFKFSTGNVKQREGGSIVPNSGPKGYKVRIEDHEITVLQSGTRLVTWTFKISGQANAKLRDRFFITDKAAWKVESALLCFVGDVEDLSDTKFCSDKYQNTLHGKTGYVDVGIRKFVNKKNGRTGTTNDVVNYITDKTPSRDMLSQYGEMGVYLDETKVQTPTGSNGSSGSTSKSAPNIGDDVDDDDDDDTDDENAPF